MAYLPPALNVENSPARPGACPWRPISPKLANCISCSRCSFIGRHRPTMRYSGHTTAALRLLLRAAELKRLEAALPFLQANERGRT